MEADEEGDEEVAAAPKKKAKAKAKGKAKGAGKDTSKGNAKAKPNARAAMQALTNWADFDDSASAPPAETQDNEPKSKRSRSGKICLIPGQDRWQSTKSNR